MKHHHHHQLIMKTHRDLQVWNHSIDFVEQIYRLTQSFPSEEKFGLVSQLRRSAISIPSNIAEGAARGTTKEYIYFTRVSLGSVAELETQLIISQRLGYIESSDLEILLEERAGIARQLQTLYNSLLRKSDH